MKCECDFAPNVWFYKNSDLMLDICLYLKNIGLYTDNIDKAHQDEGQCVATCSSRDQGCRNGVAVRLAGKSWRETRGHMQCTPWAVAWTHFKCTGLTAVAGSAGHKLFIWSACPCKLISTCRACLPAVSGPLQAGHSNCYHSNFPGVLGLCVQILQRMLRVCDWTREGQFRQVVAL